MPELSWTKEQESHTIMPVNRFIQLTKLNLFQEASDWDLTLRHALSLPVVSAKRVGKLQCLIQCSLLCTGMGHVGLHYPLLHHPLFLRL